MSACDLQGETLSDFLVNLEADFEVIDGSEVIYSEPSFPVVELARELARWIPQGEAQASDFWFSSLSFEDAGAVRILRREAGWTVGSVFMPETQSTPISWGELLVCIEEFLASVRRDVTELGLSLDLVGL
ncbi:hypothetical protein AB0901_03500 [Streptomyces roseifaciens]